MASKLTWRLWGTHDCITHRPLESAINEMTYRNF
jgi:hypothetical protein